MNLQWGRCCLPACLYISFLKLLNRFWRTLVFDVYIKLSDESNFVRIGLIWHILYMKLKFNEIWGRIIYDYTELSVLRLALQSSFVFTVNEHQDQFYMHSGRKYIWKMGVFQIDGHLSTLLIQTLRDSRTYTDHWGETLYKRVSYQMYPS